MVKPTKNNSTVFADVLFDVFDHFVGLALKRLKKSSRNIHLEFSVELQLTLKTNQKLTRINSKMFLSAAKATFLSVTDRLLHKPKLTNVMFKVINKKTLEIALVFSKLILDIFSITTFIQCQSYE